jgi:hypothetical protein
MSPFSEILTMKRLVLHSATLALLAGLPASHFLWSAPPAGRKTTVCHVSLDAGRAFPISVAVRAVPAHLRHGDCELAEGQTCGFDDVTGIAVCTTPEPPPPTP